MNADFTAKPHPTKLLTIQLYKFEQNKLDFLSYQQPKV